MCDTSQPLGKCRVEANGGNVLSYAICQGLGRKCLHWKRSCSAAIFFVFSFGMQKSCLAAPCERVSRRHSPQRRWAERLAKCQLEQKVGQRGDRVGEVEDGSSRTAVGGSRRKLGQLALSPLSTEHVQKPTAGKRFCTCAKQNENIIKWKHFGVWGGNHIQVIFKQCVWPRKLQFWDYQNSCSIVCELEFKSHLAMKSKLLQ